MLERGCGPKSFHGKFDEKAEDHHTTRSRIEQSMDIVRPLHVTMGAIKSIAREGSRIVFGW